MTGTHRAAIARENGLDGVAEGRGFGGWRRSRNENSEEKTGDAELHEAVQSVPLFLVSAAIPVCHARHPVCGVHA